MKTLCRKFKKEDGESLVEILRKNMFDYVIRHYGEWKDDSLRSAIEDSSTHIRVFERKGEIIGFFWTEPMKDFLELLEIHVAPPHQGKGIGGQMMREMEQLAKEEGFDEVRLWVFKENPAVSFYKRLGYNIISEDFEKGRIRLVKRGGKLLQAQY